jgi:5-methylcytosine-specific restriction endonuclease McrA
MTVVRSRNVSTVGRRFEDATIIRVWEKGRPIPGYNSGDWRHDMCGAVMKFSEYGNTDSKHGWEIDHIRPVSKGGTDSIDNLQPLQWENNKRKSDTYPWHC